MVTMIQDLISFYVLERNTVFFGTGWFPFLRCNLGSS